MDTLVPLIADGVLLVAISLLVYVAWYDFNHLTIYNRNILLLIALYVTWAALNGFPSTVADLAAGLVLFLLGFAMWLLRMMGAGDAKLYLGLGLFMGLSGLGLFAILLMAATLAFLAASSFAARCSNREGIIGRLRTIRETGKVPYAVPMCAAAIPSILLRLNA